MAPRKEKDTFYFISQAHIDPSWLWPKAEIACDVAPHRTFAPTIDLLKKHPELRYAQSASILYKWTEIHAPEIFTAVRAAVERGQWEIVGGALVEHSTNVPCGESLVRQHLLGKRYFMERFGVDVKIAWHPDTFGFTWALPQIYAKSGIDSFMTTKLDWEYTRNDPAIRWPYNLFWWEAADGSQVLAQLLPCWEYSPQRLMEAHARFKERHGFAKLMVLFGKGDHGGGPREEELVAIREFMKTRKEIDLEFCTAARYYEEIRKEERKRKLPTICDELYLKTHRGCLTTDAQVKRDNRRCETLLLNAERFSAIAAKMELLPYPQKRLNDLWELLCYGQVHDNIDGTSVQVVYDEAHEDYQHLYRKGGAILDGALSSIAERIDTSDVNGLSLILFNPNPWERTDVVKVPMGRLRIFDRFSVYDEKNKPVASQQVREGDGEYLIFSARVPSLGYTRYSAVRTVPPFKPVQAPAGLRSNVIENQHLRVAIDPQTGCIASVYDKAAGREAMPGGSLSNLIEIWGDCPDNAPGGEPAWNINLRQRHDLTSLVSIEGIAFGPAVAAFRVTRQYGRSTFVQQIELYDDLPYVVCTTSVDWHEKYTTMKVSFTVDESNPYATFETAFGAIQRYDFNLKKNPGVHLKFPARGWEEADRARFECAALKWIDLTDRSGRHGVSLLNDSKHGFVVEGSTMRMTCIRGMRRGYTETPEQWSDQSDNPVVGVHRFSCALYPHAGDWRAAGTVVHGENFNTPVLPMVEEPHNGGLGNTASFLSVVGDGIILTALKRAEDSDDLVIRLFEANGKNNVKAAVTFDRKVKSAAETDLIEWDKYVKPKKVAIRDGTISLTLSHNEIKTVKVGF